MADKYLGIPLPTPTKNAVPSTDIRDHLFAGAKLDEEATSGQDIYIDRLGRAHLTNTGRNNKFAAEMQAMVDRFNAFIERSGYQVIGDYEDGPLTITEYNQLVRYQDELWKITADTDITFTTAGNTAESWESSDKAHFVSVGDGALRQNLGSGDGAWLSGYRNSTVGDELDSLQFSKYIPDIYYGAFFENTTTAINVVASHDGITFSDPVRLTTGSGSLLRGRDPSIIFYGGKWLIATTANTPGSVDLIIYSSPDLVNWSANNIKLNGDSAICSSVNSWDGGTVPASLLWAGELIIDHKTGKLHLIISILIGVDTTKGNSDRMFGIYISELTDIDNLTFSVPSRISVVDNDGTTNKYSRIDATIAYNDINSRYLMAVKRENYGIIDIFQSNSIAGVFSYINSITALQTTGASGSYYRKSSIEAPTLYRMKDGVTWVVAFDPNDTFDGILYVSSSDGFTTMTTPKRLGMPPFRHGSVVPGFGLSPQAIKNLEDCRNGINGYTPLAQLPLNFVKLTESCSIIPRSDTVYWTDSDITVTLVAPTVIAGNMSYPRRFYFCLRTNSRLIKMRVTGAVAGGVWDIGWGVNNDRLIEFFYETLSSVYRSEAMGAVSYVQTRLKADTGTNSINENNVTWAPRHAKTYVIVDGDGPMTIHALPDMPVGTYFNIVIQSGLGTFQALLLKAGTNTNHLGMPTDWVYNGGGSNYDGKIIRIEKGSDRWFATR
ncbi:hypothetical protein ABW06_23300 [Pluralibacter gergoviae]|uniref:Uncharacterized protein n=1 Tax=Pluralibacter gergoviae TaxID=61647 RepID=A0A0J5KWT5_PLUGE|nr:family 43 glycosylhydrolase [Pluralibacter gergoviae]KMK11020.1 hypothetical protein ABW06_23300 [Pluralibacter gergoviae]